ncbi:hypothetical protein E3U43_016817 [Larimichthys crocea]|nr:hypothetical protein E3U43_016817 [Larimichthys crocea]
MALRRGHIRYLKVCEVQTSQNDVRDGQHAAKGPAVKVTAAVCLSCIVEPQVCW